MVRGVGLIYESYLIDQSILWGEWIRQLRTLILQLSSSLREVTKFHLSSRNPKTEHCWERSQGATLISSIITSIPTSCAHTHRHTHTGTSKVIAGFFHFDIGCCTQSDNEFFKALDFSHTNKIFFFLFFFSFQMSQIELFCELLKSEELTCLVHKGLLSDASNDMHDSIRKPLKSQSVNIQSKAYEDWLAHHTQSVLLKCLLGRLLVECFFFW